MKTSYGGIMEYYQKLLTHEVRIWNASLKSVDLGNARIAATRLREVTPSQLRHKPTVRAAGRV